MRALVHRVIRGSVTFDVSGVAWCGRIVLDYFLGVDGLSMPMVVLTALISLIGAIASWE